METIKDLDTIENISDKLDDTKIKNKKKKKFDIKINYL
jgi:hypothetical protein